MKRKIIYKKLTFCWVYKLLNRGLEKMTYCFLRTYHIGLKECNRFAKYIAREVTAQIVSQKVTQFVCANVRLMEIKSESLFSQGNYTAPYAASFGLILCVRLNSNANNSKHTQRARKFARPP